MFLSINYGMTSLSIFKGDAVPSRIFQKGRRQARQTRPNSGGVAEGHPRFDKGGVAIILFTFYALKIELFRVFTLSD